MEIFASHYILRSKVISKAFRWCYYCIFPLEKGRTKEQKGNQFPKLQASLQCSYCNHFNVRQICLRHQQGDLFIMTAHWGEK